ncbi:hypothetical protein [Castellaniella sp.]|uniref:hypothetical protein n=1 Tax=Castellaniella sp. TaxID=1955812 RepID=UPI002AFF7F58|nr:hypothetical protein [Castellaniella sp.]
MITIRTYECWIPEYGETRDDAVQFEAVDHEDAACQCVSRREQRAVEYPVASGESSLVVAVAFPGQAPVPHTVMGHVMPHYYATPVRDLDGDQK